MTAYELLETTPDAVLVTQCKLLLGDQLVMEKIGFEQRASLLNRWLVLDHALLEPGLRRALAPADFGAASFEWRQEAAGDEHAHVRHPLRILQRNADRGTAGRRMADQRRALEAERIHEAQDEGIARRAGQIWRRIALAEARQVDRDRPHAAGGECGEVAAKDIGRGAERAAMQQDRRHAGAVLEIPNIQAIDGDETIPEHDVQHARLSPCEDLFNGRRCAATAPA